jgi:hypothetical protein
MSGPPNTEGQSAGAERRAWLADRLRLLFAASPADEGQEHSTERNDAGPSLADRLNLLFDVYRADDGREYSNETVAKWCREQSGESFSRAYMWMLRTGKRTNPTLRHTECLASFFSMPLAYFQSGGRARQMVEEMAMLQALHRHEVREIALGSTDLSSEELRHVQALIDSMRAASDTGEGDRETIVTEEAG